MTHRAQHAIVEPQRRLFAAHQRWELPVELEGAGPFIFGDNLALIRVIVDPEGIAGRLA